MADLRGAIHRMWLEPKPEQRVLKMLWGRGPFQRIDNWLGDWIDRELVLDGIDPDTSTGYDWPTYLRYIGWWYRKVQGVDEWWKTRRWAKVTLPEKWRTRG